MKNLFWEPEEFPENDNLSMEEVDMTSVDFSIPKGVKESDPVCLYLEEIREFPVLTQEEEEELLRKKEEGDDRAKKKLTESYLPLVVAVSREYLGLGMQFPDLIQEGNIGLMMAVDEYDRSMEYTFNSYAAWSVRRTIRDGLEELGETSHVSNYMADTINKLMDLSKEFVKNNGRQPDPEELAEALDMPLQRVRDILDIAQEASVEDDDRKDDVEKEEPMNNEQMIEEAARRAILKEKVEELLGKLPKTEQKILRLRYGLEDGKTRTQEEVGNILGLSAKEVASREQASLDALNSPEEKQ